MLLLTLLTITQCYENDKRFYDTRDNDYVDVDTLTNLEDKRKESNFKKEIPTENDGNNQSKERISKISNIFPLLMNMKNTTLSPKRRKNGSKIATKLEKRELDDAVEYGLKAMEELINVKEPQWYKMGK